MKNCIVILSYNHPEITAKTVRAALNFQLPVILIHNGSNEKNIQKLKLEFTANVDHFVIKENFGFANGTNLGLKYAFQLFEWVLFLTNDTELISIGEFPSSPALVAPLIYFRKHNRIDSLGGIFIPRYGKLIHIKHEEKINLKTGQFFYVPGTAFLIHREIFRIVGLFDEALHTYWEDVDFSVRTKLHGLTLLTDSRFKVLHKVGKTCHANSFYSTYLFKRNQKKISWRYCGKIEKIIFFLFLIKDLSRMTYKFLFIKDRSRLRLYLKAILD